MDDLQGWRDGSNSRRGPPRHANADSGEKLGEDRATHALCFRSLPNVPQRPGSILKAQLRNGEVTDNKVRAFSGLKTWPLFEHIARTAQRCHVGVNTALANIAIGVETVVERNELDGEAFFSEQGDGFGSGILAGVVGVEVGEDLRGVALENGDLLLGESGSAGGDD